MKKILVAALIGTMALSMAACGEKAATESSEAGIEKVAESISTEASASEADSQESEASSQESEASSQESEVSEPEVAAPDFSGVYTEPTTGRCSINVVSLGNNNYKINVTWSSSAFETANWEMNATYYDSTTLMEYTDATYFIRTYSSEEEYTDNVVYTDGAGEFWFEEDGSLGWRSAKQDVDYVTGETFFERIEIIMP